jgi:hypothetical protein
LFVAGEVVGGANGANRLSGNAITEALVFGRRAGASAATHAAGADAPQLRPESAREALDLICTNGKMRSEVNTAAMIAQLQAVMTADVGPFRTGAKLQRALAGIAALERELGDVPPGTGAPFDLQRLEWFDLRNMLLVARTVVQSALNRAESRGAHQREDFPTMRPQWQRHQMVRWRDGRRATRRRHDDLMSASGKQTATLKIQRGAAGQGARFERFEVPFEPGQSVLDGLRWLRVARDPTLAIRFSCINANACKECMIQLDGKTVYACTARLEPREMTLTPLPNKKLIRDLVTEIAPPSERFG